MAFGGGEASKWLPQISIPLSCLPHIVKVFSAICDPHMGPTGTGQVKAKCPPYHTHTRAHAHTHICCAYGFGNGSILIKPVSLNVKLIQS